MTLEELIKKNRELFKTDKKAWLKKGKDIFGEDEWWVENQIISINEYVKMYGIKKKK